MAGAQDTLRRPARERVYLDLKIDARIALASQARSRGVKLATFTAKVIEIIIADPTLLENVLDGEMPKQGVSNGQG